jgi:uncharacterized metal-binding protein YceD (DUF177 family)
LRVPVDTIPRTGRTIQLNPGAAWAKQAVAAALDAEPATLSGRLEIAPPAKGTGRISVQAVVALSAEVVCARCGEPVHVELDTTADLAYIPRRAEEKDASADDDAIELAEEELEIGWYADEELDLADVLQEVVALALPPRYTCTDTAACDARTEALLAAARPAEETGHPGFAALKKLKH